MPTKPNPVTDLPPAWGGAGNYTPGVYGPTLPWGDANPLSGQPLPWGNQPRLNAAGLTSFADTGLTPQVPTDASKFNEWLRRVGIWATDWVALGTSAADADAHIMETDASGISRAVRYYATQGVAGLAGLAAVDLLEGFIVPASKTSTFGNNTTTTWGNTATISGGTGTVPDFDAYQAGEIRWDDQGTSLPTAAGRMRWNETFFSFRDATNALRTLSDPVRGYDATFGPSGAAIADTTASASRRVKENEPVWIRIMLRAECSVAVADTRIDIQITGGLGTATPFSEQYRMPTVANTGLGIPINFQWTPTDSFAAVAPDNYAFLVRVGTNAGNVTAEFIGIEVASTVQL